MFLQIIYTLSIVLSSPLIKDDFFPDEEKIKNYIEPILKNNVEDKISIKNKFHESGTYNLDYRIFNLKFNLQETNINQNLFFRSSLITEQMVFVDVIYPGRLSCYSGGHISYKLKILFIKINELYTPSHIEPSYIFFIENIKPCEFIFSAQTQIKHTTNS